MQLRYIQQQQNIGREQANKVEVAKNQRLYGSQSSADARQYSADKMLEAKKFIAQNPNAGPVITSQLKTFDQFMKNNPEATSDQQDKFLRGIGANPAAWNIGGFRPQQQQNGQAEETPQKQPQQAVPNAAQSAPRQALEQASHPQPLPPQNQLQVGTTYNLPKSGPSIWDGKAFQPVGSQPQGQ
jgi:hypothetical protein